MEFQLRRPTTLDLPAGLELGDAPDEGRGATHDSRNVLCTSGIHRGSFPIGGMRVRQARDVLRRLITIEDEAVAVINGRVVDEDERIGKDVTHVAFVKPSAVKG